MKNWAAAVAVAITAWGCANVKVTKRDGCWVRQTESFPKTVHEEIGPCARREPRWSEDRVARLVQECMAEADYRWESEALAAWNKGLPLPAQASEQSVMRACMNDASGSVVAENDGLRKRLSELAAEKASLQANAQRDLERLRETQDRMTDALGEAAKKPAPSAIATSTSSGSATTESELATHPSAPSSVNVTLPAQPMMPPLEPPPLPHTEWTPFVPTCNPERTGPRTAHSGKGARNPPPACVPPDGRVAQQGPPVEAPAPK